MASPTACRRGSACSTFAETVPTSAHRECSSATGVTWARSNSMCSARDSAHWGGLAAASVLWLARMCRSGTDVRPPGVQFGDRRHLGPKQLDVLGQGLGPLGRPGRGFCHVAGQTVQPGGHTGDLPFADLLRQPLEPFYPLPDYPLPDVLERVGVGLLISDMVLDGPGEQLAHAIGSAWLVTAKQDVVARLIHGAPSEGMARPGGRYDRSRPGKLAPNDPSTLVAPRNQSSTKSKSYGLPPAPSFDGSARCR